jgi:acetylornithine deacetylase
MSYKLASLISEKVEEKRNEIVDFLQHLIQYKSVTGNEKGVQDFISKKLSSLGLEVDCWEPDASKLKKHPAYFIKKDPDYTNRPNVVGKFEGSGNGRSILFNGHVDVIPADPVSAWIHNPWEGLVENGKLFGRGASDMKSGDTGMTFALETLLELGYEPKGDVILEYVVDEELTGFGTLACIQRGYSADAGISCEASDLEAQPSSTGSMWFEINVKGKPASMSRLWEGVSALEKGYKICRAINELEKRRIKEKSHSLYPDSRGALACFVGQFEAGDYPSSLPTHAKILGRMGVLPNEKPERAKQELFDKINEVSGKDPWLKKNKPETRFIGYYAEPAEIPAGHPICKTLVRAVEEITGEPAKIKGHEGAADTRFLINYGNTPTVIYGPGTISQMHAQDEWVSVEDLIQSVKIMALTIAKWCGLKG